MTTSISVIKSSVLITGIATALLCTPYATRAQIDDHLECYKIKDTHKFKATVDLIGAELGNETGCQVKVKGSLFCVPATKTIVSSDQPPEVFNGQTLANDRICYKMKCPAVTLADANVTDQFGTRSVSKLKPALLCTPAAKGGICPTRIDLRVKAGIGVATSATEVETGAPGLGRNDDVAEDYPLSFAASCANAVAPCGQCALSGGPTSGQKGRCQNNRTLECDTVNAPDAGCGGAQCEYFAFAPQHVNIGNFAMCLEHRLEVAPSGTFNNETGVGALSMALRTLYYVGESIAQPCPICVGDAVVNDGVRNGTCQDGERDTLPCDANGLDVTFGATSLDCPPVPGSNISGTGIARSLALTTGADSLPFGDACDPPNGALMCACGVCEGDNLTTCNGDAECAALLLGACSFGPGVNRTPNDCSDGVCTGIGGGKGTCAAGPDDLFCDGLLRANGGGLVGCSSNGDCQAVGPVCPGADCGDCMHVERRTCFLDPIDVAGSPDAASPVFADVLCVPPTNNGAINGIYGLPGPERLRLEFTVDRY